MSDDREPSQSSRALLRRIVGAPDLVTAVRTLTGAELSAVVRRVGLEDAGELVALATREQLLEAFDEDLFVNARPGERETLDATRFATWLEVLLEAGDGVAADKVAGLSEDFVAQALSGLVFVLGYDALTERMLEAGEPRRPVEKAIESCLSEELDGYLLISRAHDGWDAVLSVVLALDRNHRSFLERVLDRCAAAASALLDDLDDLASALSEADSLAEDVDAEREERRARKGYVEPRAAAAFLALARRPPSAAATGRDPITRAHFRELVRAPVGRKEPERDAGDTLRLLRALAEPSATGSVGRPLLSPPRGSAAPVERDALLAALNQLGAQAPALFGERMEELAYLSNVLVAGAPGRAQKGGRLRPVEAAEAALATVELGAEIMARQGRPSSAAVPRRATPEELLELLYTHTADELFRVGSGTLVERRPGDRDGFLRARVELGDLLAALFGST